MPGLIFCGFGAMLVSVFLSVHQPGRLRLICDLLLSRSVSVIVIGLLLGGYNLNRPVRPIARLRWAWIFYRKAMGYFDSPLYDHTYSENSYFLPDMIPKVQGV